MGDPADDLSAARQAFERHNYPAALSAAERCLGASPTAETVDQALLIKGQCLIKMRKWDEGTTLLASLLETRDALARRPDLHVALAEVGLQRNDFRHLAVLHFGVAARLFQEAGDSDAAAEAYIKQAKGFVNFNRWDLLPDLAEKQPTDWRGARVVQRKHAAAALDRAMALAGDSDRAAQALFLKARLYYSDLRTDDADIDQAIKLFEQLADTWPRSPHAPDALYHVGQAYESFKQEFVRAVAAYRRVERDYPTGSWAQRAGRNIERLVSPTLSLSAPAPVLPGQKARIHFRSRNVGEVAFQAYRVDLFKLLRRYHQFRNFKGYQPTTEPVARWQVPVPDRGDHKIHETQRDQADVEPTVLPIDEPGAYLVVGKDAASPTRSIALVLISKLSCVAKSAGSKTVVLAADAVTGKPAAGADVLIQRHLGKERYDHSEAATNDAGLLQRRYTDAQTRRTGHQEFFILRQGDHYAVCQTYGIWQWWGYGGPFRGYCLTDRPVYRPNQVVHFKATLRGYQQGRFENLPQRKCDLTVYDPRGQIVEQLSLTTNDRGSVSGDLRLPDDTPLGLYRIQVAVNGQSVDAGAGTQFRIEEYKKPEFEVSVSAGQSDCRVGQPVDVRIEAKYYFGEPVVDAKVRCTVYRARRRPHFDWPTPWPWYFERVLGGWAGDARFRSILPPGWYPHRRQRDLVGTFDLATDAQGLANLRLETRALQSDPQADLTYEIDAEVTDSSRRTITGTGQVAVTHAPFVIRLQPQRNIYQPGDTVRITVKAQAPNDEPVSLDGTFRVHRLHREVSSKDKNPNTPQLRLGESILEREVHIDQTGRGSLKWVADQEGPFRLVVASRSADGTEVSGFVDLWIARQGGRYAHYAYRDLEIALDRASYSVGDTAKILINTRFDDAYVLLTAEGDDLYDYRLIYVGGGSQVVEWPIRRNCTPNFELSATLLRDNKVFADRLPVIVPPADRFLTVNVQASDETFKPRQKVTLSVSTLDHAGQPAPAEVTLMMVDASLYYIQPEFRPAVEQHFYGQTRPNLVNTASSFDLAGGGGWGIIRRRVTGGVAGATPLMAMKSRAVESESADAVAAAPPLATAQIRKNFPDTVIWRAHLLTDGTGQATVDCTLPDTLTTWRVHAVAVDLQTRVGQTSIDLITRKDVIARLEGPRFFVEGDEPTLTVIAHNYLETPKTMRVTLNTSAHLEVGLPRVGGQPVQASNPGQADVLVPAGGEVAVDFPARAVEVGQARLTATIAADVDADAVQLNAPVITYGAYRFVAQSGSIRQGDAEQTRTVAIDIPELVDPDSPLMEIHLNPSMAAMMIDALPYLLEYPYGCTEQTMSRFLPAVVVRRSLDRLGIDLKDLRDKIDAGGQPAFAKLPERFRNNPVFNNAAMDDMIDAGVERLTQLQRPDGGWGWWAGGASNPYMTAYVVYGLTEAAGAGVKFDASLLQRGLDFLLKRVVSTEFAARYDWTRDDDNVRTWMLYALAMHDVGYLHQPKVRAVLDRIYADRDGLTDYARGMLTMVLHRMGDAKRSAILVENLDNTVHLDPATDTASWGQRSGYRYWYHNGTEATAMVLRALLKVQPDHPYVPQAVNWLVRNRRGSRWFSTKDTAFAVYALADYLAVSGELQADMNIGLLIDGHIKRSFKVTPRNALTFDTQVIVAATNLGPGQHRVELVRSGKGNLYYGVYLDYFTRQDAIAPAGHEIHITRTYARLVPKHVTKTRQIWDAAKRASVTETYQALEYDRLPIESGQSVQSGELIEVQLTLEASNNFEYLMLEDPKPAGCEPVELRSGPRTGAGTFLHAELRDQKLAFFATYLPQGKHELTYRLRCETPGRFRTLPAKVQAMYSPFVRANSRSDRLHITAGPSPASR
ncbi:MAG: MG2 domain-containing protein [Phycisphaerae bacterium]